VSLVLLDNVRVTDLPTQPIPVVVDHTPPRLSVSAMPHMLGPCGAMVPVHVDVQVQDEPTPIPGSPSLLLNPTGRRSSDIAGRQHREDDRDFELRATCDTAGARTYTITYGAADATGNVAWAETTVTIPRKVMIDIKPGSADNPVKLGSPGVLPVAILTTPEFDATAWTGHG